MTHYPDFSREYKQNVKFPTIVKSKMMRSSWSPVHEDTEPAPTAHCLINYYSHIRFQNCARDPNPTCGAQKCVKQKYYVEQIVPLLYEAVIRHIFDILCMWRDSNRSFIEVLYAGLTGASFRQADRSSQSTLLNRVIQYASLQWAWRMRQWAHSYYDDCAFVRIREFKIYCRRAFFQAYQQKPNNRTLRRFWIIVQFWSLGSEV